MSDSGVHVAEPAVTPDDIDRLVRAGGRIVGGVAPDAEPGVEVADWLNVTRFAEVSSDDNPLYSDVRYGAASAHHTMLAPPAFVLAVRSPVSTGASDLISTGLTGELVSLQVIWDDTIRLADRLDGQVRVSEVTRGRTDAGADRVRVRSAAEYVRDGIPFAHARAEVELTAAGEGAPSGRRPIHRYEPSEIDRMARELDDEQPHRGAVPRFWSDVRVGDQLPEVLRGPLTLSDLEAWVIAEGRPVRAGNLQHGWLAGRPGRRTANPVTGWPVWDRAEAALDSAVTEPGGPAAPGELLFTLAAQLVTSWMGDDAFLRRLELRPAGAFSYGDAMRLTATVVDRYRLTGTAGIVYHAAGVQITGTNQLGESVLRADAVVFLPDRGKPVRLPVPATVTCDEFLEV